jgi:hypothetical protein
MAFEDEVSGMAFEDDVDIVDVAHILKQDYVDDTPGNEADFENILRVDSHIPQLDHHDSTGTFVNDRKTDDNQFVSSRNDERDDIGATMEHLVILGNHYRHQQWRINEWKRMEEGNVANELSPVQKNNYDDLSDESDRTSLSSDGSYDERNRALKRQRHRCEAEGDVDRVVHAQDARLYNSERSEGLEPQAWPRFPYTAAKEATVSDRKWTEELSDPLNPVAFSVMRLSGAVPPPTPTAEAHHFDQSCGTGSKLFRPADYDLDLEYRSDDINQHEASRAMLLRCWERSVHAAATTIVIETATVEDSENSDNATLYKTMTYPRSNRSREEAILTCEKLHISWQSKKEALNGVEDVSVVNQCVVCNVEFSSQGKLLDHFWGTPVTEGCCWLEIERQRREFISQLLESEVHTLVHQLVRLLMMDPSVYSKLSIKQQTPSLLDGFAIWRIIENYLDSSRKIADQSGYSHNENEGSCVLETLEVDCHESPLPINSAVLEAVRFRLVDRYGRVPR